MDNINVTNKLNNNLINNNTMKINNVTFKIDEDNDLYEITVNNKTYDIYNVYDSPHGELFDELNILIDSIQ